MAYLVIFLSGIVSLMYQTLWVKQLTLAVGIDIYALSIVISGYFFGLGLGSYIFGKYLKYFKAKIKHYVMLEVLVSFTALAVGLSLSQGPELFVSLFSLLGEFTWVIFWLLIALPAFFMAGTLLVMVKVINPAKDSPTSSRLYGVNILGATFGALSVPFLLLPEYGVLGSSYFAISLNLLLAVIAYGFIKSPLETLAKTTNLNPIEKADLGLISPPKQLYYIYAVTGFVAIGLEIVWSQIIIQFMNTRIYAYAVILSVFLLALAVGNLFATHRYFTVNTRQKLIYSLFALSLAIVLPVFLLSDPLVHFQADIKSYIFLQTDSLKVANLISFIFISVYFVFPATFFLGLIFPQLLSLSKRNDPMIMGQFFAYNTFAGVVASLLVGFYIIPEVGLINTFKILVMIIVIASCYFSLSGQKKSKISYLPSSVMLLAIVYILVQLPQSQFIDLLVKREGGTLIWQKEGVGNTIAVIEQGEGSRKFRRLYIQGISNTGDVLASKRYMRLQTYLPLLVHPKDPKSALVIGLGTGITAGALINYKNLETRDVFELLKEVKEGNQYFSGNYDISDNDEVNIVIGDGRHSLLKSTKKYDLITLEPPPPTAAGVANLYSQDFYQLAKKHLTKDGVFAQWWPITTQSVEASKMIVATMLKEFKYVTWWTTEIHETLLIGSNEPQRIDKAHFVKKLAENPEILVSLKAVGINNYNQLIATYLHDESALKEFAGTARIITDDYPALEFDDWTSVKVIEDIMPVIVQYQSLPPDQNKSDHDDILFAQKQLRVFYIAATAGYMKQPEIWRDYMLWLYDQDNTNIYFNWFNPANN